MFKQTNSSIIYLSELNNLKLKKIILLSKFSYLASVNNHVLIPPILPSQYDIPPSVISLSSGWNDKKMTSEIEDVFSWDMSASVHVSTVWEPPIKEFGEPDTWKSNSLLFGH